MSSERQSNSSIVISSSTSDTAYSTSGETISSNTRSRERARKNPYPKRRTLNTEQEILLLQNSTDLMIPRAPFRRLVKEILRKCNSGTRIRNIAIEALQESSELYISTLFEDALLLTGHRQRATLQNSDLQLAKYFTEK